MTTTDKGSQWQTDVQAVIPHCSSSCLSFFFLNPPHNPVNCKFLWYCIIMLMVKWHAVPLSMPYYTWLQWSSVINQLTAPSAFRKEKNPKTKHLWWAVWDTGGLKWGCPWGCSTVWFSDNDKTASVFLQRKWPGIHMCVSRHNHACVR